MNMRERFQAVVNFQPFDRLPVIEWANWWDQTLERWRGEGLPPELTDRYAIGGHFGLDMLRQGRFRGMGPGCPPPASHGAGIVADTAAYEAVFPHLFPHPSARDEEQWSVWAVEQRRGESVLWYNIDGFFWFPRTLFGIERHLYAFYDQPELMLRMNADLAEYHLAVFDAVCAHAVPDFVCFAEDMSYNHGPMLSEKLFDKFLAPFYRRVVPHIKARGAKVFIDSDGQVESAIPWFEAVGIEGILPLERQSGVDVARIRAGHPRFLMLGAFDKMVMNQGEMAMRKEFERLLLVARQGGLVIGCDHQTPPGVSLADYQLYLRLFREYAERAGSESARRV
jgi:hypothetical protein